MPRLVVRIDLNDRSQDFQRVALSPGFPVLDRFGSNSHVIRQWLGRFAADVIWDDQTARYLWRDDEETATPHVATPVESAELRGLLRSEVDSLRTKLRQAAPTTPNDRVLLRVLQQRLDAALAADDPSPRVFFKVRVRGKWELVWCWGYERRHSKPLLLRICSNDDCRLGYFEGPETKHRCPRCNTRVRSGGAAKLIAVTALLMLAIGAGAGYWLISQRNGPALEGVIVDAVSGRPIPGATVKSVSDSGEVHAATDGTFRLTGKVPLAGEWQIEAPGYRPAGWRPSDRTTEPSRIALHGDADLSGLVLEVGTDRPIAFPALSVIKVGREVTGDDVGLFVFPGMPSGLVELDISAEGYEPARITRDLVSGRNSDVLIALTGSAVVTGTVLDSFSKAPVPNAIVRALDVPGEVRTDAQGVFRRDKLPGKPCRFEVAADGYFTREFERPLSPTGETKLRLLLRPELTAISGVVVDSSDTPLPGATVRAAGLDLPVIAGPNGRFVLPGLRRGSQQIEIAADGYRLQSLNVVVSAGNDQPVRIVLQGTARLIGQVVDAARKSPVRDAEIRLAEGRWKTTTNERGTFEFVDLPPGAMRLEVIGRGYRAAVLQPTLAAGETRADVELRSGTVLSGTVLALWDNRPVAGAEVRLDSANQPMPTDEAGRFRFEDAVAGQARLTIAADGFQATTVELETRVDEETTAAVVLRGVATLRGRVVAADSGEPVADANIQIAGLERKLASDSQGKFSLDDLPARPLALQVSAAGFSLLETEYDPSRAPSELELRLQPPHSVRGLVVDARSERPVAGATVALSGLKEPAVSDADGRFRFTATLAKSYEFTVNASGYPQQEFVEIAAPPPENSPAGAPFKLALRTDAEDIPGKESLPKTPAESVPKVASPNEQPSREQVDAPAARPRDPLLVDFFGTRIKAARVGFVVDCSGSMSGERIERTKLELLKAVLNLHRQQTFYVAFFNDQPIPMLGAQPDPLTAAPVNKVRIYKWLKTIDAGGGTQPEPALQMVSHLKPEAIFLLSDGVFDPLTQTTYDDLQRNPSKVPTIAFEDESGKQQLQEIAARTGGTYRFVPPAPIPDLYELSLVTRLFDELLEEWLDPLTAPADARDDRDALIELCDGEDFGPRANATDKERRRARLQWGGWWVNHKLVPAFRGLDEARLVQNFQNPVVWSRWAAVAAAGERGLPDATPFISRVRDAEPGVQQAARQALMQMAKDEDYGPPEEATAADGRLAFDRWTEWWRREKHRATLGRQSDVSLVHEFNSTDVKTRRAALRTIAERGRFSQLDPLIDRLTDADAEARRFAREALSKIAGKDFGPADGSDAVAAQEAVKKWQQWRGAKAEGEADRSLKLAESLSKNQRGDAAKKWYQRIITEFPKTEAAARAAEKLQALGP